MLRLRAERKKRKWALLDVAIRTRIDPTIISRLETGMMRPYPSWAERLGKAFDWPADQLDELFREVSVDEGKKLG